MKILLAEFCQPIRLLFLILFAGCLLGRIRMKGFSLNLAGVLIVSIVIGCLYPTELLTPVFSDTMKLFSSLGTSLFLSVIGFTAGYEWNSGGRKLRISAFLTGIGIVFLNFLLAILVRLLDPSMDSSCLFGTFCGAMTSTPGLAALCESDRIVATAATVGYGGAYLFGVIGVILFVQMISGRSGSSLPVAEPDGDVREDGEAPVPVGLATLCAVILCGYVLGSVRLPISAFSLGSSGGILCSGMLIGYLLKRFCGKRPLGKRMADAFRGFGLAVFFVGTGVPAGMTLLSGFSARSLAYGVLFTAFPILLGYVLTRRLFSQTVDTALSVVCGIMTSTPAIGILWEQKHRKADPVAYSLTYTGALLAMVFSMRICAV